MNEIIARDDKDLHVALWLMGLSYLRYALKGDRDSRTLFDQEREELRLCTWFATLLEQFIPPAATAVSN
jgi:hypothetical protein